MDNLAIQNDVVNVCGLCAFVCVCVLCVSTDRQKCCMDAGLCISYSRDSGLKIIFSYYGNLITRAVSVLLLFFWQKNQVSCVFVCGKCARLCPGQRSYSLVLDQSYSACLLETAIILCVSRQNYFPHVPKE